MSSPIGGMKNVKIFVLYLLENINYPLDFPTINDIVMQTDYVMYLDFAEGFFQMVDMELIETIDFQGEQYYLITEKGRCVARELKSDILSTVLDQSLTMALRYLDFKKRQVVTKCRIEPTDDGRYNVICSFTEKEKVIFEQLLTVDTLDRAERMKENFYQRPEAIYRGVTALLAGNVNYLFN
ncbi:MAG: DUF4364 family protein [Ruminococcaceae bacterium]|nr:DUF4364 family protein [Oscillospiraceae bacterium]